MPLAAHLKTVYAIQHLAFEDLGSLEDVFYQFGFRVRYFEAGVDDLSPALNYEGLTVILGGPIGVYETEDYPFLVDEIAGLKQRLKANKPTIGICLGAQLIAHALGAKVYAGHQKEIGWSQLEIKAVEQNPLAALENVEVLHWHGDTFDLPADATLLASSAIYPNQAFSVGNNILALQFHLEVVGQSFEKWLIGHTCEIRHASLSIPQLRQDNQAYAAQLENKTAQIMNHFLSHLDQD
ncbi:glutamine amidotransferase [Acinetobacter colistiniresistens]|uniref:GMP synthase (Glutamine-hydrolysing) n=1 Tax=Acinetobacter colistiniresistens TaxID=280145 RepID=S3UD39_9GAMM|nr:glutamine amidotransferase [Acinetobacter colistiniresistens]EPG37397.1 GMP synthase (glutamine-hydrolysing) [Acinetobacter colistiniresistens]TVT78359.1 glutamine amidotransferase [Acinetobacter colistiniresistens]